MKGVSIPAVDLEEVWLHRREETAAWTDSEVLEWGNRFKGLVLTPIDRNQGDTVVMCPILYRHGFGKTFAWEANYEHIGGLDLERDTVKKIRDDFHTHRLDTIGKWRVDGRLGAAYVIPKHKDLTRWRPIAPAPADPVALAQKRVAKALHCLLKRLSENSTFYLNSISELSGQLNATTVRLRVAGCERAIGRCYNIKHMFSRIPHNAVKEAVRQLLRKYEDEGVKQVRVSMRGKLCVISNNKKKMDGYVSIPLKKLMTAVAFDLRHSVVKCGQTLVRQVFGIPMGKSTSPILASITCAMAEMRFLRELGCDRRLVGGWRIVDDITVVVGITEQAMIEGYEEQVFERFESIYDEHLEIVRKDECGLTWDFVGGHMFVGCKPLMLHYTPATKNTAALNDEGRLLFQTMQDYSSYSPKAVKKAVLTATLRRIWGHTTSKQLVLGAIGFAVCEADLWGYPPGGLSRCFGEFDQSCADAGTLFANGSHESIRGVGEGKKEGLKAGPEQPRHRGT
ncbi:hypothetical protein CBR_g48554 [Chara braunii]|uniref:Reverse transcriptase domain-containing protein n=1 Tax=Chara braunii TaxID=69332 RepID=A0A388M304_CHABU|nr:hypothetical protein CBR_g48554 [Chara braunii]|eukprot:GBG88944.1 hypothetical protein CBR_g48554 [Chara braunii]